MSDQQAFGREGESLAADHLVKKGYRILARNYQTPRGEIDIIGMEGDTIVFVEVKARRSDHFGNPKCAVTRSKQKKISMAALHYLKSTKQSDAKARFDVVSIRSGGSDPAIELIRSAFGLACE